MSAIESIVPMSCSLGEYVTIQKGVQIGENVVIRSHVNLYGCKLKDGCKIGTFVEVQSNAEIGENTTISSHSFICSDVKIGKNVWIGHSVVTINDTFSNGKVNRDSDFWKETIIEDDVIIGSNCTIFPVKIGKGAIIGAGSVVTKDVGENEIWYGNPAKFIKLKS